MTPGKTISLTRWTFAGKVMSLLFNMLYMLVITFLPRSKRLLISWLQSPSAVILEPPKIKSVTVFTVSPSYLPWSDETRYVSKCLVNINFLFLMAFISSGYLYVSAGTAVWRTSVRFKGWMCCNWQPTSKLELCYPPEVAKRCLLTLFLRCLNIAPSFYKPVFFFSPRKSQ